MGKFAINLSQRIGMKKMEINWKHIIIGFILIFILSVVFTIMADNPGAMIGYLLGTIYVGYAVGGDYKKAAIHGALAAFLVGTFGHVSILILMILAQSIANQPYDIWIFTSTGLYYLMKIGTYTIIGIIGGIIGRVLKGPY